MDNYNPDLIFDLAAGSLPADEARAAEAALSPEGRAELQAQRTVMAFIAASPPATMTDLERARLRRSVASAISETTRELSPVAVAARPAPHRPARRTGGFVRWASAAAAAAVLVGVVAVGSQLGGLGGFGSDDAADTIVAAEMAAATSTTAAGALNDGFTATAPGFSAGDSGGDGATTESSDRFGLTDELLEAPALQDTGDKADLEEVTAWLQDASRERSLLDRIEDITALPCYAVAAEDDDLDIVDGFLLDYVDAGGMTVQGIAYADGGTDTVEPLIRVYDLVTCESVVASTD